MIGIVHKNGFHPLKGDTTPYCALGHDSSLYRKQKQDSSYRSPYRQLLFRDCKQALAFNVYSGSVASRGSVSKAGEWWVVAYRNGKIEE